MPCRRGAVVAVAVPVVVPAAVALAVVAGLSKVQAVSGRWSFLGLGLVLFLLPGARELFLGVLLSLIILSSALSHFCSCTYLIKKFSYDTPLTPLTCLHIEVKGGKHVFHSYA